MSLDNPLTKIIIELSLLLDVLKLSHPQSKPVCINQDCLYQTEFAPCIPFTKFSLETIDTEQQAGFNNFNDIMAYGIVID